MAEAWVEAPHAQGVCDVADVKHLHHIGKDEGNHVIEKAELSPT